MPPVLWKRWRGGWLRWGRWQQRGVVDPDESHIQCWSPASARETMTFTVPALPHLTCTNRREHSRARCGRGQSDPRRRPWDRVWYGIEGPEKESGVALETRSAWRRIGHRRLLAWAHASDLFWRVINSYRLEESYLGYWWVNFLNFNAKRLFVRSIGCDWLDI